MRIFVIVASIVVALVSRDALAESVWVQVRESVVRSKPRYYASGIVPIRYGEKLEKLSESSGWAFVRVKNIEGYVPLTSVSLDQIVLRARELAQVPVDTSDVVLAGKGFNKEVENSYRSSDPGARFDLVDKVEQASNVSPAEVERFKKRGGLP